MKPTTQAEYDALYTDFYGEACAAHVEAYHLHKSMELSHYCDFWNNLGSRHHAYGTGLSKEAHAEAQEAGRMDKEYQEGKLHAKVRKYL